MNLDKTSQPCDACFFPPAYGLLTDTLQPAALETIEYNVAGGNPRPTPRFFVPFRNNEKPDLDNTRLLGPTVARNDLFRSKDKTVRAYNLELRKLIAATDAVTERLKSMLVKE